MECPALSLPVGLTKAGLPVGLQLVADTGRDDVVLAAAAACERQHPEWAAMVPRESVVAAAEVAGAQR